MYNIIGFHYVGSDPKIIQSSYDWLLGHTPTYISEVEK